MAPRKKTQTKRKTTQRAPGSTMANRRKTTKTRQTRQPQGRKKQSAGFDFSTFQFPSLQLSETAQRELSIVFLVGLALLFLLSLMGLAGMVGDYLAKVINQSFGAGAFLLPLLLVALGLGKWRMSHFVIGNQQIFGIAIGFLSILGLMHLAAPANPDLALAAARMGEYGGYFGYMASVLLQNYFGLFGAMLLLVLVFLSAFPIALNMSIQEIYTALINKLEGAASSASSNESSARTIKNQNARLDEPKSLQKQNIPVRKSDNTQTSKHENSDLVIHSFSSKKQEEKKDVFGIHAVQSKKSGKEELDIKTPGFDKSKEKWQFPGLALLDDSADEMNIEESALHKSAQVIEDKLSQFGIDVTMNDVHIGPTVMRYTMRPAPGVKLSKITNLEKDMALALRASSLRIEAPIPGTDLVGIEIPNKTRIPVRMKELFQSKEFAHTGGALNIIMGRDVAGNPMVIDIAKTPHMLVAGNTGSGKSVFINSLLVSLLYQHSPNSLKLILIDPKHVELENYNNLPNLLTPVISDPDKAVSALKWAVAEMNRRYRLLKEQKQRSIDEYNEAVDKEDKLPYIVIVIDEMSDLMMASGKEVEALVVRLAQMARAIGIHLVLATQRPSVNVITGLIKANVPTRIAFTVASQVDSRTIIDQAGSEDLLGKGDMLFMLNGELALRRVQAPFLSTEEVNKVVYDICMNNAIRPEEKLDLFSDDSAKEAMGNVDIPGFRPDKKGGEMEDDMYEDAIKVVVQHQKASATMLQRYLSVGYARAAKLIDLLEQGGVISEAKGAKPREVYVKSLEDLQENSQ